MYSQVLATERKLRAGEGRFVHPAPRPLGVTRYNDLYTLH